MVHTATTGTTARPVDPPARPESKPDARRWWTLALLGAAQFMLVIDVTVVNVALPSIGRDLALDRAALTWVATAYTLLFGSLLLLGGRLADTFGRRRVFLIGLGIFTVASATSGLASDGTVLVLSRTVQGIGAALLSPAALSIITTTFEGPDRNRALSVWAALGGSGAAFGVVLGGALTTGPGWQWIFFVNVPVGVLVAVSVSRLVAVMAPPPRAAGVDLLGASTIAPAIGLMLYALIGAGDAGWTSLATLGPIGIAVILAGVFVWRERVARAPLVRLGMLADRTLSGALVVIVSASALLAGAFFLDSLYLQRVIGLTALETGLVFVPVALALIAGSQVASHLLGHAGGRTLSVVGLIVVGAGLAMLARVPVQGDVLVDVMPGFVVAALGIGATLVAAMTTAFTRVASEDSGLASGLVNTSHELGFAVGVAIVSSIGGASLAGGLGIDGFQAAFLAGVVVAAVAAGASLVLLPADRPTGPRRRFAH